MVDNLNNRIDESRSFLALTYNKNLPPASGAPVLIGRTLEILWSLPSFLLSIMTTTTQPYSGSRRKLVLAFDVGTTYSGISYRLIPFHFHDLIN